MRLSYIRENLPQLPFSLDDLKSVQTYLKQLAASLAEWQRFDLRGMRELDTAPVLSVARITSDQSLSATTLTPIQFNSVVIDTHSWWNSATYTYTPQEAGFYRCAWSVNFHDSVAFAASTFGEAQLNTTHMIPQYGNGTATDIVCSGSAVVECNGSTDTIKLNAYILTGTAPVVYAASSPYRSWLTIDYIGRRAKTYG